MRQVERKAGISFQRIGAPQPLDIIKAGAKDAAKYGGGRENVGWYGLVKLISVCGDQVLIVTN